MDIYPNESIYVKLFSIHRLSVTPPVTAPVTYFPMNCIIGFTATAGCLIGVIGAAAVVTSDTDATDDTGDDVDDDGAADDDDDGAADGVSTCSSSASLEGTAVPSTDELDDVDADKEDVDAAKVDADVDVDKVDVDAAKEVVDVDKAPIDDAKGDADIGGVDIAAKGGVDGG